MRKEGENLFKWLWRKYNEFYDEAGFSQVGGCRRCLPFIKEDPPLERPDRLQKLNEDTRQFAGKTGRIRKKFKTFQFRSILWFCFLSAWLAW